MMPLTVQTICAAVGGTVLQSSGAAVRDVTTDSRRVPQEALFIPLVGERFDGHAYIEKALEAGAAGCLTAKTPETLLPGKFYIQVPDTRLSLKALAAWYRGQFRLPVVQVTGSVGKTTTKEMIAAVLSQRFSTLKTQANFNNAIGTPLTLLNLAPEHQAAVIETGMDHFGEIRYLGEMVRPHIAVITNIGDAHIEFLGSREGILKAKSEIFENLDADGVAILNGDDALLDTVALPQRIVRCGESAHADVRVSALRDRGIDGIACTVITERAEYQLNIPAPGRHMIYAASLAVAVGEELGLSVPEIERGVEQVRVELSELRHHGQNDIRQIERDVRDEKRRKAENVVELHHLPGEREEQRERDARDDLRVRERDIRHGHRDAAHPAGHGADADGGHGAEHRRHERGDHRDDDGVCQQRQQHAVAEERAVLREREALPYGDIRTGVERRNGQHDHRDIQKQEHDHGENTVEGLHIVATSSSSEKRFMTAMHTSTITISTSESAAPRFGL